MKFCVGDFLLDNALWSGRPVEVDSDEIETLIENNQHCFTWEIANILKIFNKVIGKNDKYVYYFMEKNKKIFLPTQYF